MSVPIASTLPGGIPRLRLIFCLAVVVGIGPMSIDMYLPSLPGLALHFGSDEATTQLTLAAYFIGLSVGQLFYGPISDALGRKKPLLFGLTVYVLATLGCLFARSMEDLIVLRLLQALGGCAGMVVTRAIVRDCFPLQEMAKVLSLLMLIMGVAPILAPMLGGYIYEWFGWQAVFLALTLYGVICWFIITLVVPETHLGIRAPVTLKSAAQGYLKLMRHRRFMGYALAGSVAQAGMFAYISSSSFVFIRIYGITPAHYAWLFGLNAFGMIAATQLNAMALNRYPVQRILRWALRSYLFFGVLMLAAVLTGIGGIYGILVPLFFCCSSLGFSFPNTTAAAMAPFGDRAGSAAALLGTMQFTIASLSSFAAGHLYNDTAVPMAAVIALCGLTALIMLRVLVPYRAASASAKDCRPA